MKALVLENVSAVESVGLSISAIVLDQGPSNVGFVNELEVTQYKPYITTEQGNKIFIMYDYCHLLKSVRNTLLAHDISTNKGTLVVNFFQNKI